MNNENTVNEFINHFHKVTPTGNLTECFTCGCCYWFAYILCSRFPNAEMVYDTIINHFVAKIDGRLYDITGDVTEQYDVIAWKDFEDEAEKQRIIDYSVNFTKE